MKTARVDLIKNAISNILRRHIGEVNDVTTRREVEKEVGLLFDIVDIMGVTQSRSYVVICDHTNNTPEVIDNRQLGVDVSVQFIGDPQVTKLHVVTDPR